MLGLVITLAVAAAPPASVTCVDGPTACEAAPALVERLDQLDQLDHDLQWQARAYATPAVLDCRLELVPLVLATLVGECDGTPRDASYRVSRTPDGLERAQTIAPAPRDKRAGVATCGGLPPRSPTLTLSDTQALAVFATPAPVLAETEVRTPSQAFALPSRFRDPPDRPPRV